MPSYTFDEPLTPQEQVQLEAWYAQKDSAEAALLEQHQSQLPNLTMLQGQLDAAMVTLTAIAEEVQQNMVLLPSLPLLMKLDENA